DIDATVNAANENLTNEIDVTDAVYETTDPEYAIVCQIAFPVSSCGIYGYPADKAASIAPDALQKFLDGLQQLVFVLWKELTYNA
ncbi:unnamed protein product, partial [Didymodactylos carnosus]